MHQPRVFVVFQEIPEINIKYVVNIQKHSTKLYANILI